jgi:putative oxidoreductase
MSIAAIGFVFGRVVLASLFILAAFAKLGAYDATLARMTEAGLSPASLLLPATIGLEFFGGVLMIWGRRVGVAAALMLAAFTIATNFYFHAFWTMEGSVRAVELSLFFKNVAVAGGLIAAASALWLLRRSV